MVTIQRLNHQPAVAATKQITTMIAIIRRDPVTLSEPKIILAKRSSSFGCIDLCPQG
ncbi:hypothetical protein [Lichenibacterium ramalinae]|uniref:hypothetical protein n=1 Tax=Lichenibacterium ramalinae TaxID=2316527 RepID=UPI0013EDD614|nr:hypothetical protein [Lichenibacterium ramalinae]